MKYTLLFNILFIGTFVLLLNSCHKSMVEEPIELEDKTIVAEGKLNGEDYKAWNQRFSVDGDRFTFKLVQDAPCSRLDISFRSVPYKVGSFPIREEADASKEEIETGVYSNCGDSIDGVYYIDDSQDFYIVIESIDNEFITGSFTAKYHVVEDFKAYSVPTFTFDMVSFKIKNQE